MENENNNMNQGSTYHFGRNESPFGREDISGRDVSSQQTEKTNPVADNNDISEQQNNERYSTQQPNHTQESSYTQQQNYTQQSGNPYHQGTVYGQGIYTGNDFQTVEPDKKKIKEKKQSSGKAKKVIGFIASAAAFGLIAGGVMVGVNAIGNKILNSNEKAINQVATVAPTNTSTKETSTSNVADVAEQVMPSIVSITNTSVQVVRSWFQSYEQEVSGSGSGIIIGQTSDEILIVTNNHVIEGAKEITVAFCDETAVEATVKGVDSSTDLAVIEVKTKDMSQDTLNNIKVAALGSSDDLRVGDSAIAIGNALGYGQSVTVGYISALNREVDVEEKSMTLLQTDAAINPGNSGGALLNTNGEVIGINTVKFVDSTVEGMGYAIPISSAIPIINDLMNREVIEESEQGYLGIQGRDITEEYAQGFNMPEGVYVVKIVEGSPAYASGLRAGDIITKFANRDIGSMETLQNILSTKKAGEEIEMTVQRNTEMGEYEEVTFTVVLGAKKDMPEEEENVTTEERSPQQSYPEDFFDNFNDFYDFYNNW